MIGINSRPTTRHIPSSGSMPAKTRHKSLVAVYFIVILLDIISPAHCQLVTISDQTAKEGDVEVVMTCDFLKVTSAPGEIQWDEVYANGNTINLVNDKKLENGRFTLNISPVKADLVISQPMRSDSQRRFQCEIRTPDGDIISSNPSILTVYSISDGLGSFLITLIILIFVALMLWLLLLVYFMYYKKIELSNKDINRVESDEPFMMSWTYRPSIARFKTFEIKKEDKVLGSSQTQFSSCKMVCQFVCYCCLYFCGFCCIEYYNKSFVYKSKGKKKHESCSNVEEHQMMVIEREIPAEVPVIIKSSSPNTAEATEAAQQPKTVPDKFEVKKSSDGTEYSNLLSKHQQTSDGNDKNTAEGGNLNFRSQTSYSMFTNGRGSISLAFPNSVRSDSGEYNCNIEGRHQYPGVSNLSFYWIEVVNQKYSAEQGVSNFEMKCRYGPAEYMPVACYKWKKIKEDGTTEIGNCKEDYRFVVTSYQNSILSLKIKNVILGDAGNYKCEVKPVDGEKKLEDTTHLTVRKATSLVMIHTVVKSLAGGEAKIHYIILPISYHIKQIVFQKLESNTWKTVADNSTRTGKYCITMENNLKGFLNIVDVQTTDAGEYRCHCLTGGNYIYSEICKLEVVQLGYMDNSFATHGEKAILTCKYKTKDEKICVSWYTKTNDGNKLIWSSDESQKTEAMQERCKATCDVNGTCLEFEKVALTDAGEYVCKLSKNVISEDGTNSKIANTITANLCVQYMLDSFATHGEKAVLTCKYETKDEKIGVSWYKKTNDGNKLIWSSDESQKTEAMQEICKATCDVNGTCLEFEKVALTDAGEYMCKLSKNVISEDGTNSKIANTITANLCVQYTRGEKVVLTCNYETKDEEISWWHHRECLRKISETVPLNQQPATPASSNLAPSYTSPTASERLAIVEALLGTEKLKLYNRRYDNAYDCDDAEYTKWKEPKSDAISEYFL
ncbi:uncharacterized protein [Antedon mediterranea]|uniref:uncharacterized protein isoform X2 n=1 Tax=Antedon mediterranea TaxID=105859 RepID=UPI003AF4A08E